MDERKNFEAWLNPGAHAGNVSQWVEPGRYEKDTHSLAWLAWQACAEQSSTELRNAVPVAEVHPSHLRPAENSQHWCREVLLYSGGNPGDTLDGLNTRIKLYATPPVTDGFVLVPAEPTPEMVASCLRHYCVNGDESDVRSIWESMLAAALNSNK
jgi:hypothetical protein